HPSDCAPFSSITFPFQIIFYLWFPLKDSKRLIQWLKAVQRDNWIPTKYSFLCSEHFTKDSFSKRLEDQHRLLKPTAIPSIFHISEPRGNKTLSSGQDLLVEGTNNMENMTLQAEIGSVNEQGENFQVQLEGSLRRMLADNLVTKVTQHKPENHSIEDHSEQHFQKDKSLLLLPVMLWNIHPIFPVVSLSDHFHCSTHSLDAISVFYYLASPTFHGHI
uniref:THAP-type domain-containing protein n=1 Tax=Laticauda laticaudata TaxID=8630 RepID=A0A8C5RM70_LATLA